MEGTSASVEYQQKLYVALASLPYVENICEIGFNGGHSAQLWLAANPRARVFMFDKRSHPDANERALKWLHSRPELSAAKRLELISGWSHLEVRKFAKERPTIKCDLLSIDGSHTMFGASNDLKNAHLIVRPCCHLALLDDTVGRPRLGRRPHLQRAHIAAEKVVRGGSSDVGLVARRVVAAVGRR